MQEPSEIDILIGCNIKLFRHLKSLTIMDLAIATDILLEDIEDYENGRKYIHDKDILKIAQYFNMHTNDFYTDYYSRIRFSGIAR